MCLSFLLLTNNHSSLKQYLFIFSQFCGSEVQVSSTGLSTQGLRRENQDARQASLLSGGSGKESTSKSIQVAGRMQFLTATGMRCLFSCWLQAQFSLSLDNTCLPFHIVPSIFKSAMSSHALNPNFYSYQPENALLSKGMYDQIKLTGIISLLSYNINNHRNDILFSGSTHMQRIDGYIRVRMTGGQSQNLSISVCTLYLRWVSGRQYTVGFLFFIPILQSLPQIYIKHDCSQSWV